MITNILEHFQRIFTSVSSHYNYSSKQEYYGRYLESLPFDVFSPHNSLINQNNSSTNQSTTVPIKINGQFFGSGVFKIILKMRRPKAIFRHNGYKHAYKILFYKIKILKYPSVLQLHFYKNRLFFGKYVLGHDKSSCIEELPKLLSHKYKVDDFCSDTYLTDVQGNQINYKIHSNFELNYYSNLGVIEEIQQELAEVQLKKDMKKDIIYKRALSKL